MARKKKIEVQAGSGNVFADLGYPDSRPPGRRRTDVRVLKGMIERSRNPVSVEDMRKAVARRAGR